MAFTQKMPGQKISITLRASLSNVLQPGLEKMHLLWAVMECFVEGLERFKLIKTHLYRPEIFFPFSLLCFSFLFISSFLFPLLFSLFFFSF